MNKSEEMTYMKVRLFRLAQQRWEMSFKECGAFFKKNHIYDLVDQYYERFHVQGDEVNLDEIEEIIGMKKGEKKS